MTPRVRKRDRYLIGEIQKRLNYGHTTAGGGSDSSQMLVHRACVWTRREWVEDVNHAIPKIRSGDPIGFVGLEGTTATTKDRGGPLWVRRNERRHFPGSIGSKTSRQGVEKPGQGNWSVKIHGGSQLAPSPLNATTGTPVPFYGSVPSKSVSNFDLYGPKGWRKWQPLNPKVSTSQFLAELRELPRNPFKLIDRANYFKTIGQQYLNWEFGWKPFLKDMQAFYLELSHFNERLEQILRDNGKAVRRKGEIWKDLSTSSSTVTRVGDFNNPVMETWYYEVPSSELRSIDTTEISVQQKYWFSGSFRYWIVPFETAPIKYLEQIGRIVYGIDISPRLFYELMPWSWLIDWLTSVGDSISNFTETQADSLVAEYAYAMHHYQSITRRTVAGPLCTATYQEIQEVKSRAQATPYGFGLNNADLSIRQKAILTSLFLTKGT